jgi:HK97 gp10 family phage protein
MTAGLEVLNGERLLAKLDTLMQQSGGADVLEAAALAGAKPIENRWEDAMLEDPTTHLTGTYRRSVQTEVLERSPEAVTAGIGTDITDPPYPKFLEFGTSRMRARPKARPAFLEKKDEAVAQASKVFLAAIKKAAGR